MFPKEPRMLRDIPGKNKQKEGEPNVCSVEEACERFTEFDVDWLEQEFEP